MIVCRYDFGSGSDLELSYHGGLGRPDKSKYGWLSAIGKGFSQSTSVLSCPYGSTDAP